VSAQPSAQVADLDAVRRSLAEVCGSCDDFEHFFSGVFDRLEEFVGELVRRQRTWMSQRHEAENELSRRKAELAEALQQADRRRRETENLQTGVEASGADDELRAEIGRLEQERDELRQQQQLMELELDTVRGRAAELAEQLAQQRGQLLAERTEGNEELKRMRRVIESLARQSAEGPGDPVGRSAAAPHKSCDQPQIAPVDEPPGADDPVLGSVVAQFEMLQKDVAGRRRKVAGARG